MHRLPIAVIATTLLLGLTASCGGGSAGPDISAPASTGPDKPVLKVLPDTWLGGASADAVYLQQRDLGDSIELDVLARDASKLKALFFELNYDASRLSPLEVTSSGLIADPEQRLELSLLSQPGHLEHGQMLMRPQESASPGFSGDGVLATVRLRKTPFATERTAAAAPSSNDAAFLMTYDSGTQTFSWPYKSPGDYNQDGRVAVSDLTPIGLHFGESVPLDFYSIQAVVDGNIDGQVALSDLTPIGLNFGAQVNHFKIYSSLDGSGFPASNTAPSTLAAIDSVPFSSAVGDPANRRLEFSYTLAGPVASSFWVRPADTNGVEGTSSGIYDTALPVNNPPTVNLLADVTEGVFPLAVNFTADASDADGDPLHFYWDFNGDTFNDADTGAVNTVNHSFDWSQVFNVTVYVYDGTDQATASLPIRVTTAGGNVVPSIYLTANPPGGFSPLNVEFTATASDPDAGQTLTYFWDLDGDGFDEIGPVSDTVQNYGYTDFGGGFYTVRVTVSDGVDTNFATVDISVSPPDNPPTFDFFNSDVVSGPAPLTVNFSCSASDIDGDPVNYLWDFEGTGGWVNGTDIESHTYMTPGTYNCFVRAEDGIEGTTAFPISITVTGP